jgi:hypothetical protein
MPIPVRPAFPENTQSSNVLGIKRSKGSCLTPAAGKRMTNRHPSPEIIAGLQEVISGPFMLIGHGDAGMIGGLKRET